MWHLFRTIKGFMLLAALTGSLLLFAGVYLFIASLYERTLRADAREVSAVLADQTFDAMFQVMRKGWTRAEVEEFLTAMRGRVADTPYKLEIYRGELVEALYGTIAQPPADNILQQVFRDGRGGVHEDASGLRHLYPLRAREECLGCHSNASVGDTLGVIELQHDLRPVLQRARSGFMAALWLVVPAMLLGSFLVAMYIHRRIDHSVQLLRGRVGQVNKVSDLVHIAMDNSQVGFRELDDILGEVRALVGRLRAVAVDKDLLEFEIRLLERFIITSEVVRDWHDYVNHLLLEINQVMEAYMLFSVFKVDDEVFHLETFWRNRPSSHMTQVLERSVRVVLQRHPYFSGAATVEVNHHVADVSRDMPALNETDIELQSKSLFVETPKIGGIVGIGVQAGLGKDPSRLLVMESVLSTLLNVIGSVKAIYKYTKELEYYATRDPLTHLYNQRAFWELLEYETERVRRKEERFGLLLIDVDNFKDINDTHGHAFGDAFLQALAGLLRQVFRRGDIVARYGGDEFVVLLTDTPENQAWDAACRLVGKIARFGLAAPSGTTVHATVSVGIALCPDHAQEARDLFLIADKLMYRAKQEGKNRVLMAGSEEVAEIYRGIGAQSFVILAALEERRFIPYFQPIVATADNALFGHELLSRMQDEDGTIVDAGNYIAVAERMGVVHKLDYQVLEHAFEAIYRIGYRAKVFINLSPKALIMADFLPTVERLVRGCGIDPTQLVFELREHDAARNMALVKSFVGELKLRGFRFALGDFGSGFSSFHHLKHLPVDYIKISGDFIRDLMHDERDRVFVRHLATMACELRIHTIAQCIEDAGMLEHVRAAGIEYAQGYHLGRPGATLEWHNVVDSTGT